MARERRLTLAAIAALLAFLMVAAYLAALLAGLTGGQRPGPGAGEQATETHAPPPKSCANMPVTDLSVTSFPDAPGVVGYLNATQTGSTVTVTIHVVNNGTEVASMEWLGKGGFLVRLYSPTGRLLASRQAKTEYTAIAPREDVRVTVRFTLPQGVKAAYVIAINPLHHIFMGRWLVDPRGEAGACGWHTEDYPWGTLLARWVALREGLVALEMALIPDNEGPYKVSPVDPTKQEFYATIYDSHGSPMVKVSGPLSADYTLNGPWPHVVTVAAATQLGEPSRVEVEFNIAVNGAPLRGFSGDFTGPWPNVFPGSWRSGVIKVEGDGVSLLASYYYNGYVLVVKNATIRVSKNMTLKIPADFRNTPLGPPTPGALIKVMASSGQLDQAMLFLPRYKSDVARYVGSEQGEGNRTVFVYRLSPGSAVLTAWSRGYGFRPYAILSAPYDVIDGVLIETPWGSAYLKADDLAHGGSP